MLLGGAELRRGLYGFMVSWRPSCTRGHWLAWMKTWWERIRLRAPSRQRNVVNLSGFDRLPGRSKTASSIWATMRRNTGAAGEASEAIIFIGGLAALASAGLSSVRPSIGPGVTEGDCGHCVGGLRYGSR